MPFAAERRSQHLDSQAPDDEVADQWVRKVVSYSLDCVVHGTSTVVSGFLDSLDWDLESCLDTMHPVTKQAEARFACCPV